jgi:hypothetical protein
MEIRARINPISYEKPLLKRRAGENIVAWLKKISKNTNGKHGLHE